MVLEKLGDSLKNTLTNITNAIFVDEKLINQLVKDIQRALLQADVNVSLVFELSNKIKERALKEKTPSGLTKKEHLIKIVYDSLTEFLGGKGSKIDLKKEKQTKIMLVGLFGNGKTTTAGKLANYYKKRGLKIAVVQTDTYRPAAYEQLEQQAKKIGVDFFGEKKNKNALKIYENVEKKLKDYDLIIVDTAGRDSLNDELIDELNKLNKKIKADENLLVISADIGQAAQSQAEKFHNTCGVTGIVITRMDGTAKGGGSLSACSATNANVKFIGVGEKINDLEEFDPEGFVSRLLGMGDIKLLLEKAKDVISEEDAKDLGKKFLKGEFNLIDLYEQMETMKKMGPLSKIAELIPGMGQLKIPKEAMNVQEGKLKKWRFIMDSCTKEELEEPDIISSTRIDRIAKGSGTNPKDIRELLKQYKQSKKMMKMFKGGKMKNMEKMMKKMGGAGMPKDLKF